MKGVAIHECPVPHRPSPWLRCIDRLERWFGESVHASADRRPQFDLFGAATPLHFEIGRFRFRDLFPPWVATRAIEGNPTSDVFITDPSEILDNAQLIIAVDLERQTPFR